MKRVFDLTAATVGIVVLWPVMAAAAILVKLGDGGPILYRQRRMGRGFQPFDILKFRTMVVGARKLGPGVTSSGDVRVTRVGRVLRASKIDELPQLFNVFLGQMSFVGPRPEIRTYVDLHPDDYHEILRMRPGITDLASIAYRDESSLLAASGDPEAFYREVVLPHKIRMAKSYMRHASLGYDLKLIFATLRYVVRPRRRVRHAAEAIARFRARAGVLARPGDDRHLARS